MRCIAIAKPSRVSRPSLLMSARSLDKTISALSYKVGDEGYTPNLCQDVLWQVGLQHERNSHVALDITMLLGVKRVKELDLRHLSLLVSRPTLAGP
jgi:hypothetical protein